MTVFRSWGARATPQRVADYLAHFERQVLPMLRRQPGFAGYVMLRRGLTRGQVAIEVQTRWRSLDDIRAFAGPDIERAVVGPEADALLIDYDRTVSHWTVEAEGR